MSTNLPTISKNEMISVLQGGLNLSGSYVSEKIWLNDFNFYIEKGSIIHLNNGKIHKDDGPAIIEYKNDKISAIHFYMNGDYHNENGPAYIRYEDGKELLRFFYVNGQLHRLDGPAIEHCKDENCNNEFIEGRLIKKGLYYSEEFTKTREKETLKRKVSKI